MERKAYIKDICYYLPERILTNAEITEKFPEWPSEKIAKKVGITERHIASPDETALDLALLSARLLIEKDTARRDCIDFVLFVSQSGDYKLPPSACILQHKLGLKSECGAFDINLGCSGYEYGLAVAKGLVIGGIAKNVLLLTSETYSKYLHPEDKGNITIFGDASSATLISEDGFAEIGECVLGTDGSGADMLKVATGGARLPEKSELFHEDAGGNKIWDDYLYMDGAGIFNFTADAVPKMIDDLLKKENEDMASIDLWIFHQANKYMINYLRKLLEIDKDKFFIFMEKVGNTVSNTIPIALCEARTRGLVKGNVVLVGFGVGLSWGATMLHCR